LIDGVSSGGVYPAAGVTWADAIRTPDSPIVKISTATRRTERLLLAAAPASIVRQQ
jgi:hypothetical protein